MTPHRRARAVQPVCVRLGAVDVAPSEPPCRARVCVYFLCGGLSRQRVGFGGFGCASRQTTRSMASWARWTAPSPTDGLRRRFLFFATLPDAHGRQALRADRGVMHRHGRCLVAEELLHEPHVDLIVDQRVAGGVPQRVRVRQFFRQACSLASLRDDVSAARGH